MNAQARASAQAAPGDIFQLTPPEVITPVSEQTAKTAVPIPGELKAAVGEFKQTYR